MAYLFMVLIQTTVALALCTVGLWAVLSFCRCRTAWIHQLAWGGVLLLGLVWVRIPISIPWNGSPFVLGQSTANVQGWNDEESTKTTVDDKTDAILRLDRPQHAVGSEEEVTINVNGFMSANTKRFPSGGDYYERYAQYMYESIPPAYQDEEASTLFTSTHVAAPIPSEPISSVWGVDEALKAGSLSGGWLVLPIIWGMVFASLLICRIVQYIRMIHIVRCAEPPDAATLRSWESLLDSLPQFRNLKPAISIRITPGNGPALVRTFSGYVLLLPRAFWDELADDLRIGVLRHELAHYVRGDIWKILFAQFVVLLHWFNPLSHFAARRFEEAIEWSVDSDTYGREADGVEHFAAAMLVLHDTVPQTYRYCPAFGRNDILRRLDNLEWLRTRRGEPILKTIIVIAFALVLLGGGIVSIRLVAQDKSLPETPSSTLVETETTSNGTESQIAMLSATDQSRLSYTSPLNHLRSSTGDMSVSERSQNIPVPHMHRKYFDAVQTKFVRVVIHATFLHSEPCFDELEFFPADSEVNLASQQGVLVSASSMLPDNEFHNISHLNDGRYGNSFSWIAAPGDVTPWVQYEFSAPKEIASLTYSRDRTGKFIDRYPMDLELQVSSDGRNWASHMRFQVDPNQVGPVDIRPMAHSDAPVFQEVPWGTRQHLFPSQFVRTTASLDNALKVDKHGLPNLALLSEVKVAVSGSLEGYSIHQASHLNDGKLGNNYSWIADQAESAWAELDLGETYWICRLAFGSDSSFLNFDRAATEFRILTQDDPMDEWKVVYRYSGEPIHRRTEFAFQPERVRRVRLVIDKTNRNDPVRIDEIEVFGRKEPISAEQVGELTSTTRFREPLSRHDLELQRAFLGEEQAWLKVAGFADIDFRLRNTNRYPVHIFPQHAMDDVLPLPAMTTAPRLDRDDDSWKGASEGSVRGTYADNWDIGPMVEQSVAAATHGDYLYLRICGNRFLSEHIAMVSVENPASRGLIVYADGQLIWKPLDARAGNVGAVKLLEGSFDSERCVFVLRLPLSCLPGYKESGLYVALGIGCRWAHPGGRPVHFFPADFSVRNTGLSASNQFVLSVVATGDTTIRLRNDGNALSENALVVPPKESREWNISADQGALGNQKELVFSDENGARFRMTLFRYDPARYAITQMDDLLVRRKAKGLETAALENELTVLKDRHQSVTSSIIRDHEAERQLLWDVRITKRNLFFNDGELAPLSRILFCKRYPFHPSHNYSDLFNSTWRPGGGVWTLDIPFLQGSLHPASAVAVKLVDAESGVIRNPVPSFDANRVYFAHRVSQEDYFRIFELDLRTGNKRRLSAEGPFHDFWPTPLPDGGMAFLSTRCKKRFICWRPQAFTLFRMEMDGSRILPLSYANLSEFAPSVMNDGRIIWTRSEYVDKGSDYGHTLWSIRQDGTMPELIFGNTIVCPQGYANAREVPDSTEICAVMISHFGDLNGPVALIDLSQGPHESKAINCITPEVPWPGYDATVETFREPFPISRDLFLVSHNPHDRFGLYVIDRFGNRELLYQDPEIDSLCAQPLQDRPTPPVLYGAIDAAQAAENKGQFFIADVYRGLEHQVERGTAKYLRICEEIGAPLRKMPDGTYQDDHDPFPKWYAGPVDIVTGAFGMPAYTAKGVIGTIPIEEDGSANFIAPAGKVLYFSLLDESKNEIQRMRSVIQLQPGEQRSCIGCHENRLSVPIRQRTIASLRKPSAPVAPPWGEGPFWFESHVQPVLDARCVSCHNETISNKIILSGTRDEESVPRSYRELLASGKVHYFDYDYQMGVPNKADPYTFGTSKSELWSILADENHTKIVLTPPEKEALKIWIDLNVPLWGDYAFRPERKTHRPQDAIRWNPTGDSK